MRRMTWRTGLPIVLVLFAGVESAGAQQIGKYVPIQAGSEADHALTAINAD
jgi:hypothetical protein